MIVCKELNTSYESKDNLFKALRENKNFLFAQKKQIVKEADAFYSRPNFTKKDHAVKSSDNKSGSLTVKSVINTIGYLDSHGDVHIEGIWSKSVKEQKNLHLLQEHQMTFKSVISDNVKAYIESRSWKDLGFDAKGETEVLLFESVIEEDRNPYMYSQYKKGYVRNHSVGMVYVKYFLAMNSDNKDDQEEKEIWDSYIDKIINKEEAIEKGYFWVIKEAKILEGSAVVVGSNPLTPSESTQENKSEPTIVTHETEPSNDTQKDDFMNFLKSNEFINIK